MPIHNSDGTLTEDRSIVVYDPSKNRHVPAGHVWDASLNKFVPSGEPVKLPASMIPLSTETGNALRLSQADGNLYVAPTAVINVADDQGLTASATDSARVTVSSTTVDTLVNGVHETTVNHDFHVDVKVAATPASGIANALSTRADGLYVAKEILGEDVPPSTASDGGVSATIYGGLNATMGDPSGWLQLAIPQADGAIWLFKVPHYGKTIVPSGQNVFTYKPTTEGEGETPPPPETPPGGDYEGGGEQPTTLDFLDVVNQATGVPSKFAGFVTATNAVKAAVDNGTIAPITNFNDAATHIYRSYAFGDYQAVPGTPMTSTGFVDYIEFLHLVGLNTVDLSGLLDVLKGTGYPALTGTNTLSTVVNSETQYMRVNANATAQSALIGGEFTWTTDAAQASRLGVDAVNLFTTAFGFVAYRNLFGGGNNTPFLGVHLKVN